MIYINNEGLIVKWRMVMNIYPYLFGALSNKEGQGDYQSRICDEVLCSQETALRRLAGTTLNCLKEQRNYLKKNVDECVWIKGELKSQDYDEKKFYIIGAAASGRWFLKKSCEDGFYRDLFYFAAYIVDDASFDIPQDARYLKPIIDAADRMNEGFKEEKLDLSLLYERKRKEEFTSTVKMKELLEDSGGIYSMEYAEDAWAMPLGGRMCFFNVLDLKEARKVSLSYPEAVICCSDITGKEIYAPKITKWKVKNEVNKMRNYMNKEDKKEQYVKWFLDTLPDLSEMELVELYMMLRGEKGIRNDIEKQLSFADQVTLKRCYKYIKQFKKCEKKNRFFRW